VSGALGRFGEAWARGYLVRKGYRILDTNIRYRVGEIDIVARDADQIVFVEVKIRRSSQFGTPADAVTARKYQRLELAIDTYLKQKGLESTEYRLDVVALVLDARGTVTDVQHLEGVEAPG
jgi:putative endonuclease